MTKPYFGKKIGGHEFKIYNIDASILLESLEDDSADVIFLDPPFNIGKNYQIEGFFDRDDPDIYMGWLTSIIRRASVKLKPGGALYIYHLPSIAYRLAALLDHSLDFRHWIAVSMKNNFARGRRLYPAHYALLYFTKGKPGHFFRPKTEPKRCRHCGKIVKDYGGYRAIIEEKGINLSDFWDDRRACDAHRTGARSLAQTVEPESGGEGRYDDCDRRPRPAGEVGIRDCRLVHILQRPGGDVCGEVNACRMGPWTPSVCVEVSRVSRTFVFLR